MTTRILGPRTSRRRRRFLLGPIFLAALAALFLTAGAQAVHDTGKFQLDGNALTSLPSSPPAAEDWDKVCPAVSPPSRPLSDPIHCLGGTTADDSVFIADLFVSGQDDIFKGGTDADDIGSWLWKNAGPSPDKADIEQAFAAQYTVAAAPYNGDNVLFFGGTRYANAGSTNIGYWFFQKEVTTAGAKAVTNATTGKVTCPVNSGCGFTGLHTPGNVSLGGTGGGLPPNTPGDIFILSEFTQGGAQPLIKVFEWVGPGNATPDYLGGNNCFTSSCTLQPLAIPLTPGFSDNRCADATVSDDVACALVNSGPQDSPWIFDAKEGATPNNTFSDGELYEGGLNLTGLGFGDVCFQSTLLNTRSSPSGTSVLQDFAIGGFGACESGTVTTPQLGDGTAIPSPFSIGTTARVSVRDHAEITLSGVSSAGGTVQFSLCGPLALNSTSNCESGGVDIGSPVAISATNPAIANSAATTLTSAGRYCWRAVYSGDPDKGVPGSSDPPDGDTTSTTECFSVLPVTPTLTTSAGADVTLGSSITDTATLSGTAKQPGTDGVGPGGTINATAGTQANAGGSITWSVQGPNNCDPSGLTVTGSPATVSGDNTYGPVSALPTVIGKYTFVASYDGSSPNTLGAGPSSCPPAAGDGDEEVIVTDTTSVMSEQDWLPNDTATVAPAGGSALNGTMTFTLYPTANCTGTPVTGQTYTRTLTNATSLADRTKSTSNGTYKVTADATVSWKVTYDDTNSNVGDSAPVCETTSLTIDNDVPVGP